MNTLMLVSELICSMHSCVTVCAQDNFVCTAHYGGLILVAYITLDLHLCTANREYRVGCV